MPKKCYNIDEVSLSVKVWDEELARISQRWADQCMPGHDQRRNVGEALHADHDEYADAADDGHCHFQCLHRKNEGKNKKKESQTDTLLDRTWRPHGLSKEFLPPRLICLDDHV